MACSLLAAPLANTRYALRLPTLFLPALRSPALFLPALRSPALFLPALRSLLSSCLLSARLLFAHLISGRQARWKVYGVQA